MEKEKNINPETGVDEAEVHKAATLLQPRFQGLVDSYTLETVLAVYAEAFFGVLKTAGASNEHVSEFDNRMLQHFKGSRQDVEEAYRPIGQIMNDLHKRGVAPLAVAYGLLGLGTALMPPERRDNFLIDGLEHINATRNAVSAKAA